MLMSSCKTFEFEISIIDRTEEEDDELFIDVVTVKVWVNEDEPNIHFEHAVPNLVLISEENVLPDDLIFDIIIREAKKADDPDDFWENEYYIDITLDELKNLCEETGKDYDELIKSIRQLEKK